MITATKFRQKTCLKCKGNHDNDGPLCGFCIDKEKQRRAKQIVYPKDYMVECLIEREGDTEVIVAGMKYLFKRNDAGHSVCDVVNYGHYNAFVNKMGKIYRPYRPVYDYPQTGVVEPEPDDADRPLADAQLPDDLIKEPEYDGTGVDNGQAGPDAGGNCADIDRPGSSKQRGKRDRAGAGTPEIGSEPTRDQPELCSGSSQ